MCDILANKRGDRFVERKTGDGGAFFQSHRSMLSAG